MISTPTLASFVKIALIFLMKKSKLFATIWIAVVLGFVIFFVLYA